MKVTYISSYVPRQCGIATFTNNLCRAVYKNTRFKSLPAQAEVVAMNDNGRYDYPEEVKFTIRQDELQDYYDAAEYINGNGSDICVLQHEYGIFGGDSGAFILPLLHNLKIPLISTFHTVLREPSFTQKAILQEIARKSEKVVVMSRKAIGFLIDVYKIPSEKIELIEHGVPDHEVMPEEVDGLRKEFGFDGRKVLFTFGLISRNKGIETVIEALPKVKKRHPDLLYMVLGNTHPGVIRHSGEEYREYLQGLVKEYGLENQVHFQKGFMEEEQLFQYLSATDIYITPYHHEAQITSGTLSYAVGAGAAVVSTPYWHAQELLEDGRGCLFEFKNSDQLARILIDLLDNPKKLQEIRQKAKTHGEKFRWKRIGGRYLHLMEDMATLYLNRDSEEQQVFDPAILPPFSMEHVRRLTDQTGIIQHAKYGIPNLHEGYCIDDNSRALLMALMAYRRLRSRTALDMMTGYLSFMHYMQNEDGSFRNFLSYNRQYLDAVGSEDAFGRTVWALGYLIRYAPTDALREFGKEMFGRSYGYFDNIHSLKGLANTVIGISYYLRAFPTDEGMRNKCKVLVNKLTEAFHRESKDEEWQWFEPVMTYDNGILPLALLHASHVLSDDDIKHTGMAAASFLEKVTFRNGYFTPVGNEGWYCKGGECPVYAQQAIDVMALVLMYNQAYELTEDKQWLEKVFQAHMWFLGENELRLPLYDNETKGCHDGLERHGINRNQGAESTLAYLISHLTVLESLEAYYSKQHDNLQHSLQGMNVGVKQ